MAINIHDAFMVVTMTRRLRIVTVTPRGFA
jgi:hypothetical protein